MSQANPGRAYGHRIRRTGFVGDMEYRISWTWNRYYAGSRQRFPQTIRRYTSAEGAARFAKKWGCELPVNNRNRTR